MTMQTIRTRPAHTTGSDVTARLGRLRELAAHQPAAARDELVAWLADLGHRNDRTTLDALVASGTPPTPQVGDTDGTMLGRLTGTPQIQLAGRFQHLGQLVGLGWTGKTFADATTGYNRLTARTTLPMAAITGGYRCEPLRDGEVLAFRFEHRLEPSALVPGLEVRAIVYDGPGSKNPRPVRRTRDEIVELLPGTHLGQALLAVGTAHRRIGFFTVVERAAEGA